MRKLWIVLVTAIYAIGGHTQEYKKADSLRRLIAQTQLDTEKVHLYFVMAGTCFYKDADSFYVCIDRAFRLSSKIGFLGGKVRSYVGFGMFFSRIGDFPMALQWYLKALQNYEQLQDTTEIETVLDNLGQVYYNTKDYVTALSYNQKCLALCRIRDKDTLRTISSMSSIAEAYTALNILDSAVYYSKKDYELILQDTNYIFWAADPLTNLGDNYLKLKDLDRALYYYHLAWPIALAGYDFDNICESAIGIATIFEQSGKNDSALVYVRTAYNYALESSTTVRQIQASAFIANYYKSRHQLDSAYKYLELTGTLKDSLYNQEKLKAFRTMTEEEEVRQHDLEQQRIEAKLEADRNLQRGAIAVFIPAFFLFVLLLSRSKVSGRTIEFLAMVGLLLFFEFVSDLLFPFISRWTNDSPLWETLIFVLLACFLEPLSYRMERWIKFRLDQKGVLQTEPALAVAVQTPSPPRQEGP